MRKALATLSFALVTINATAENTSLPVTVFGLPLGGKIKYPIRACQFNEIAAVDVKSMCWVSPPFAYKGTRSGSIMLPGPDSRPLWAVNGTFEIDVRTDGTLENLGIQIHSANRRAEIQDSISSRFGQPINQSSGQISRLTWERSDIKIELFCAAEIGCKSTFRFLSPELHAEIKRAREKRNKVDAARPVSP